MINLPDDITDATNEQLNAACSAICDCPRIDYMHPVGAWHLRVTLRKKGWQLSLVDTDDDRICVALQCGHEKISAEADADNELLAWARLGARVYHWEVSK